MKTCLHVIGVLLFLLNEGCREKYDPELKNADLNYLVVEGIIISGGHTKTTIRLSRTSPLSERAKVMMEKDARVTISVTNGNEYLLIQEAAGVYVLENADLPVSGYCRLRIITAEGKEYVSENILVNSSPPITEIGYYIKREDALICLNTRGDEKQSRYYQWLFEGTYEYRSQYLLSREFHPEDSSLRSITEAEQENLMQCWKEDPQTKILIGSSAGLKENLIFQAPLHVIPGHDIRLAVRYSMLVKQYAMPQEAYDYWSNVRKVTEELGDIFGTLPSEIKGNIRCVTSPDEPVLGFVYASTETTMRKFFSKPESWRYRFDCANLDSLLRIDNKDTIAYYYGPDRGGQFVLTDKGNQLAYGRSCVECVLRGGTNTKPSFWP